MSGSKSSIQRTVWLRVKGRGGKMQENERFSLFDVVENTKEGENREENI